MDKAVSASNGATYDIRMQIEKKKELTFYFPPNHTGGQKQEETDAQQCELQTDRHQRGQWPCCRDKHQHQSNPMKWKPSPTKPYQRTVSP